jgi:hypothetical protein
MEKSDYTHRIVVSDNKILLTLDARDTLIEFFETFRRIILDKLDEPVTFFFLDNILC